MRCLGTIIDSPVKLVPPDLRDTMIEVGTKRLFFLDLPPPSNKSQAAKKMERQARFLRCAGTPPPLSALLPLT